MSTVVQILCRRFWVPLKSKRGQTLVEYALILAVLSVVAVAVFGLLSSSIESVFKKIIAILDTAQASGS